jgi:hypothetical protein
LYPTRADARPSGAWLVFPTIMIIGMGSDIVDGLAAASGSTVKSE